LICPHADSSGGKNLHLWRRRLLNPDHSVQAVYSNAAMPRSAFDGAVQQFCTGAAAPLHNKTPPAA
jgi:hypothetical protein